MKGRKNKSKISLYPEAIFANGFEMIQHKQEITSLLDFLRDRIHSFIEIGSHKGGTFFMFSQLCTGKKISIDYCNGDFGGIGDVQSLHRNNLLNQIYPDALFIEGNSHDTETQNKLIGILGGERVDFLFIDGDHTYEGVKQDYNSYKQFVREGGYISFHDIVDSEFHKMTNCCVSKLWKELEGEKQEFTVNGQWGGIGIIKCTTQ